MSLSVRPPTGVEPVRSLGARGDRPAVAAGSAAPKEERPVAVSLSQLVGETAAVPIDHDRVAEIRRAIEAGRYPVIPTRIADAMIAAGLLLRRGADA